MKLSEIEIVAGVILGIIAIALLVNYFWANPSNKIFCGDGICSNSEKTSCQLDCDWCGDGYCQNNEDCSSCQKDCGNCKASSFCGDGTCNIGECEFGCTKDCSYSQCQNGKCEPEAGENCVTSPIDCKCFDNERCDNSLKKCIKITCGDGICSSSESFNSCPNDCKQDSFKGESVNPDTNYPIIFVHGHSIKTEQVSTFSINAFTEFQNKLMSNGFYYDKGIILPNSEINAFSYGEWGRLDKPISVRTTYYIGTLDSSGTFIQSSETSRSINDYGERLGKVVDIVLHHTGKKKVIIVAHSMGGLVSRAYIKNYSGESNVDKLITIGTPNHGIWRRDGFNFGCNWVHEGQECSDMHHDSFFISAINSGDETYGSVKYLTIAGNCEFNGEDYDDEVIRVTSVKLDGATNKIITRNECISGTDTFHGYLISPSKVLETYNYVIDFLKN